MIRQPVLPRQIGGVQVCSVWRRKQKMRTSSGSRHWPTHTMKASRLIDTSGRKDRSGPTGANDCPSWPASGTLRQVDAILFTLELPETHLLHNFFIYSKVRQEI